MTSSASLQTVVCSASIFHFLGDRPEINIEMSTLFLKISVYDYESSVKSESRRP